MSDQENSNEKNRWCAWCAILSCLLLLLNLALLLLPVGAIFYFLNIKEQDKLTNLTSGSTADAPLTYPDNAPSTEEIGNCIDEYIKEQVGENGLYGHGEDIANAGKIQDVNPGFIVAIGQAESSLGTNITSGNYNYQNYNPPNHDFASWEDAINHHAGYLAGYIGDGQNTIVKIGQGKNGTYVKKTQEKYAPNDCDQAVVDPPAYCPCGYAPDGIGYGTSTDLVHDPHKVNQYWIPNVTKFFDQVAAKCGYLAPPTPGGAAWCYPTPARTVKADFKDQDYADSLGFEHLGIDYAPTNADEYSVSATRGGTVIEVNDTCPRGSRGDTCGNMLGNYIKIDHKEGYVAIYAHLEKGSLKVNSGDTVYKAQEIARIDSSGNSDGDHLHFQVELNGTAIDPKTLPLGDCALYSCGELGQKAVEFALHQIGKAYWQGSPTGGWDDPDFDCAGLFGSSWYYATGDPRYYHSRVGTFEAFGDVIVYHPTDILSEIQPGDGVYGSTYYGTEATYTDFGHMGIYVGAVNYNGQQYQHAVVEARGTAYGVVIREFTEGSWVTNLYSRPIACQQ